MPNLGSRRLDLVGDRRFEGKYLNGGSDWRAEPYSQVDVSLDTSQFHSGTRALADHAQACYGGSVGKSMKGVGLAVAQKDSWLNITIDQQGNSG